MKRGYFAAWSTWFAELVIGVRCLYLSGRTEIDVLINCVTQILRETPCDHTRHRQLMPELEAVHLAIGPDLSDNISATLQVFAESLGSPNFEATF